MLTDTIVAVATPNGRGGIGIVRLSGPKAMKVASKVVRVELLRSRTASYTDFFDAEGICRGISGSQSKNPIHE